MLQGCCSAASTARSIGVVGAFVLAKIEFYSNFEIGLLNSLVGFGVGYGVLLGCKRGGVVPAVLGGVLAFFAMMLGRILLLPGRARQSSSQTTRMRRPQRPPSLSRTTCSHMTLDWLFIAIGVYGGAKTPLRADGRPLMMRNGACKLQPALSYFPSSRSAASSVSTLVVARPTRVSAAP